MDYAKHRTTPRGWIGHLQEALTRPDRVRLRYGLRVRPARLRRTDYSASRSLGYLSNGQLQGELLSAYEISQAYLAHPVRAEGARAQRPCEDMSDGQVKREGVARPPVRSNLAPEASQEGESGPTEPQFPTRVCWLTMRFSPTEQL